MGFIQWNWYHTYAILNYLDNKLYRYAIFLLLWQHLTFFHYIHKPSIVFFLRLLFALCIYWYIGNNGDCVINNLGWSQEKYFWESWYYLTDGNHQVFRFYWSDWSGLYCSRCHITFNIWKSFTASSCPLQCLFLSEKKSYHTDLEHHFTSKVDFIR